MTQPPVLFTELRTRGGARIGIATLNAEKSLNSLTLEMIDLLMPQVQAWAVDAGIAFILLEGAGERAFCAGADLTRLHAACLEHHASDQRHDLRANRYALDFFSREYRLDYFLHRYPKPVMTWGNGVVMGGGMGLMVGASHRVVTDRLRLAMPEINIGLYPDVGGSWFLPRAPGKTGIFLALTAAQLAAPDAIFAGLADVQIAQARKAEVMQLLADHLWHAEAKRNHRDLTRLLQGVAITNAAPGPLRTHFDAINAACSGETAEEVVAGINALAVHGEWFERAAAALNAGSPTTAALSIALQRRLRHCSLAEVFRAELVASLQCCARPDLAEGIRALLIDKDRQPKWQPAAVQEVTAEEIEAFFASPWARGEGPLADLA